MPFAPHYQPRQIHAELGEDFHDPVAAAVFPAQILRYRNQRWAERLGLGGLSDAEWLAHFAGFAPLPGSFPVPLALRYHGHQFRQFNPQLGDGRGFLFAQLMDDGQRVLDLGTKGSGQTPWSRGADGRLTLKGGVREVLAASLLEALGVDTSKPFSLVETGEQLVRHDEPSPTRSSVLVRLSHSHLRIGSFQRLAYRRDEAGLRRLIAHCLRHYLPEAGAAADEEGQALAFLTAVTRRVARVGAQWMAAGFVHGVLNTDNINITGESFDYGPWRFLPHYDPGFTAAYFDHGGLYAYGRQPQTLLWNLARLAECLLPLAAMEKLEATLEGFAPAFEEAWRAAWLWRLGLRPLGAEPDRHLAALFETFLQDSQAPFEQAVFDWQGGLASAERAARSPAAAHYTGAAFDTLRAHLAAYHPRDAARLDHPYFRRTRPCTLLIDEVEALWAPIAAADDWSLFHAKMAEIALLAEAMAD
ncbi:YdiU family protein [Roseomonas sp. GC11]|uniref:protein adenylyltransferase SelO n=1 Tax=Roseomonas sp. GC11 TaxID=2950546 RepID=UPI002109C190|nr:YdiU family protein [Roseomonas sp. GC11]MCQ4160383.1 YdiU family protein [Roseomonas sp. GC11]